MVARLKLKGIDGRAPPGVEPVCTRNETALRVLHSLGSRPSPFVHICTIYNLRTCVVYPYIGANHKLMIFMITLNIPIPPQLSTFDLRTCVL